MTFKLKGALNASLRRIVWHPEVVFLHKLNLWNWQTDAHVRVECYRQLITVGTPHSAFELTMHQVNNDRLVSLQMVLP